MVRQLFRDASDAVRDGFRTARDTVRDDFRTARDTVRDGFGTARDSVRDTYRAIDKIYENPPHIKLALPNIKVSQNDCNTIININNNAFISGLNLQFVHRNPFCAPLPPPQQPPPDSSVYVPLPEVSGVYIFTSTGKYFFNEVFNNGERKVLRKESWDYTFLWGIYPLDTSGRGIYPDFFSGRAILHKNRVFLYDANYVQGDEEPSLFSGEVELYFKDSRLDSSASAEYKENFFFHLTGAETTQSPSVAVCFNYQDALRFALAFKNKRTEEYIERGLPDFTRTTLEITWSVHELELPGRILPPPPPPLLKDCCRMGCCPNVEQTDQLLRLILKRIGEPKEVIIFDEDLARKGAQKAKKKPESLNDFLKLAVERTEIISRIVGIENFPVTVPDTMIEPHKEGVFGKTFGFIDGKKKRKINTVIEFIAWMSEQDSAVLGQFHQVIEFETGGKDKKGKAEKATVVLPNVAETLKEIIILTSQMAKQNNVQTELIFKIAAEVVAARAAAHKSALIAADIQDYLDYPTETKTGEIATSVNFPHVNQNKKGQFEVTAANEDYKEFLKAGNVKFTYDDWTGDTSLRDQMMDLLLVASALRASALQRIDK